jgi:hypothetical protein
MPEVETPTPTEATTHSCTCAKEPNPAGEAFGGLPAGLSKWVGALQLTVIFAATGFIGKVSLQQFLGIDLGNWSSVDLTLFAGHWAFETLTVVLNQVVSHPGTFGLPFFLYVVTMLSPYAIPVKNSHARMATMGSIGLTTVALLIVLYTLEMPTLSMNNWLTQRLSAQLKPNALGDLNQRTAILSAILLESKMEGVGGADAGSSFCFAPIVAPSGGQLTPSQVQDQQYEARQIALLPSDTDAAKDRLERYYGCAVLVCMIAWFTMYFHAPIDENGVANELFRAIRLGVSLVLLPTVTCLLPYMYAKLIYATTFSEVTVAFKKESGLTEVPDRYLIVDETEKDISLLTPVGSSQQTPSVQVIDRAAISKLNRTDTKDVINNMLVQCSTQPATSATKPEAAVGPAKTRSRS